MGITQAKKERLANALKKLKASNAAEEYYNLIGVNDLKNPIVTVISESDIKGERKLMKVDLKARKVTDVKQIDSHSTKRTLVSTH